MYKRLKAERDNAGCDIDDYELLDNIVHRDGGYGLDEVEGIIRDLINERAGKKDNKNVGDDYDRAMKGLT
jgi:hypothetical protein